MFRLDNGGEYVSGTFAQWCQDRGIGQQFSSPYSPQQNGRAERLNRTLLEKVRAMLLDSGMSEGFWVEAFKTANYLRIRSAVTHSENQTPYEMFTGTKPTIAHLHVLGSTCYVTNVTRAD